MSHRSIFGQRGYVLALALFGAHALEAVAQETEVIVAPSPSYQSQIPIYGMAPSTKILVALPPAVTLYIPYLGEWVYEKDITLRLSITEDGYKISQKDVVIEQGQFALTQDTTRHDGAHTFKIELSDRMLYGAIASNQQETWFVSEDQNIFKRIKDKKAIWRRVAAYPPAKE